MEREGGREGGREGEREEKETYFVSVSEAEISPRGQPGGDP